MANDKPFRRFLWQDKSGRTVEVRFYSYPSGFDGYAYSESERGGGKIHIWIDNKHDQMQSIAHLEDVVVDDHLENRGIGTMLVREAIKECKQRGYGSIDGYLSSTDQDHFPKLKHFYTKLGFSVVFFTEEHPNYSSSRVGKIEMVL